MKFNIFQIEYHWFEGEYEMSLLIKNVESEEFEKDLSEAKYFAENLKEIDGKDDDYLGKGYRTKCIPEFYEQIVWFLITKKGYNAAYFNEHISYTIGNDSNKIDIIKNEEKTKRATLNS